MSGKVVIFNPENDPIAFYEAKRHESLARIIAELKGYEFDGCYDSNRHRDSLLYFVPHYTIVGRDLAENHGIRTPDDFFGGIVPLSFLSTKAIVHDLVREDAVQPEGWNERFSRAVSDHVVPGYTAFDPRDAHDAGKRLLQSGPIRLKDAFAAGGQRQVVAGDIRELKEHLEAFNAARPSQWAMVIELNLEEITTYSVGQIYLGGFTISYWGTQRVTCDNTGTIAYGGSDLNIVRGGFDVAAALAPSENERRAVQAALAFDAAVSLHYPEIIASRKNYDVAIGRDAKGVTHSGVLDQSWRIGGTSGVEVAAVRIFKERDDVRFVKGSSFNVYGSGAVAPPGAIVHFHDVDHECGPMLMFTLIEDVQ